MLTQHQYYTDITMVLHLIIDCVWDIDYITHKTCCKNTKMNKYNLINCCGSLSPAIYEDTKVGLLHHTIACKK
jgi:hypothetical protein